MGQSYWLQRPGPLKSGASRAGEGEFSGGQLPQTPRCLGPYGMTSSLTGASASRIGSDGHISTARRSRGILSLDPRGRPTLPGLQQQNHPSAYEY